MTESWFSNIKQAIKENDIQDETLVQAFADGQVIVINGKTETQISRVWDAISTTCRNWATANKLEYIQYRENTLVLLSKAKGMNLEN